MKTLIYNLKSIGAVALVLLAFSLGSCTKEEIPNSNNTQENKPVHKATITYFNTFNGDYWVNVEDIEIATHISDDHHALFNDWHAQIWTDVFVRLHEGVIRGNTDDFYVYMNDKLTNDPYFQESWEHFCFLFEMFPDVYSYWNHKLFEPFGWAELFWYEPIVQQPLTYANVNRYYNTATGTHQMVDIAGTLIPMFDYFYLGYDADTTSRGSFLRAFHKQVNSYIKMSSYLQMDSYGYIPLLSQYEFLDCFSDQMKRTLVSSLSILTIMNIGLGVVNTGAEVDFIHDFEYISALYHNTDSRESIFDKGGYGWLANAILATADLLLYVRYADVPMPTNSKFPFTYNRSGTEVDPDVDLSFYYNEYYSY